MIRAPLWRQRLPFAGLLGAATMGIVGAGSLPIGSVYWVGALGLAMVWWIYGRKARWLYLAVAMGFGALQIWQGRESPSAELAAAISGQEPIASAVGLVKGDPVTNAQKKSRFTLALESLEIDGRITRPACDVLVYVKGEAPQCGDRVSVTGNLRGIPPPRNPAQFDARRILGLQGISCEMMARSPRDVEIVQKRAGFELLRVAGECRRWMEGTLRQGISGEPLICNLLDGMVLGATSEIPDELQDQYRQTGTYHLFSVSGLHVGMIAVILWQALRVTGIGRRQAVFVIIPALFFYALITGWKPSCGCDVGDFFGGYDDVAASHSDQLALRSGIFDSGAIHQRNFQSGISIILCCCRGDFIDFWAASGLAATICATGPVYSSGLVDAVADGDEGLRRGFGGCAGRVTRRLDRFAALVDFLFSHGVAFLAGGEFGDHSAGVCDYGHGGFGSGRGNFQHLRGGHIQQCQPRLYKNAARHCASVGRVAMVICSHRDGVAERNGNHGLRLRRRGRVRHCQRGANLAFGLRVEARFPSRH